MDGESLATQHVVARADGHGRIGLHREPALPPGQGQVRVRLEGCSLARVDPGQSRGALPVEDAWGRIEAVGAGVDPARNGRRVAIFGARGIASHALVAEAHTVAVPDALEGLPVPALALAETLALEDLVRVRPGQRVAIVGGGFRGGLLIQLANGRGADVIALSNRSQDLDLARRCGAQLILRLPAPETLDPASADVSAARGCDVVIELSGAPSVRALAMHLLRDEGRLVLARGHPGARAHAAEVLEDGRGPKVLQVGASDCGTVLRLMADGL